VRGGSRGLLYDYKAVQIAGGKTHTAQGKKAFGKIVQGLRNVETFYGALEHPLPTRHEAWRAKVRAFDAATAAGPVALASFSFA